MTSSSWSSLACLVGITLCLFPLILIGVASFVGMRHGRALLDRIVLPDPTELNGKFEQLRAANVGVSDDVLVQRIISHEALKCGAIGFVTGIGGIPFMLISVPIDAALSMRIQATMIQFISRAYGQAERSGDAARLKTYLILAGSEQLTAVTANIIRSVLLRTVLKSLFEVVPFLGGIIGFVANYIITRSIGMMAVRWYHGDLQRYGLNNAVNTMTTLLEESGILRTSSTNPVLPAPSVIMPQEAIPPQVSQAHALPVQTLTESSHQAQALPAASMVVCHECETYNPETQRFCTNCGTALT